jgi:hypothetical protein
MRKSTNDPQASCSWRIQYSRIDNAEKRFFRFFGRNGLAEIAIQAILLKRKASPPNAATPENAPRGNATDNSPAEKRDTAFERTD